MLRISPYAPVAAVDSCSSVRSRLNVNNVVVAQALRPERLNQDSVLAGVRVGHSAIIIDRLERRNESCLDATTVDGRPRTSSPPTARAGRCQRLHAHRRRHIADAKDIIRTSIGARRLVDR